jgi:hypothetical protein
MNAVFGARLQIAQNHAAASPFLAAQGGGNHNLGLLSSGLQIEKMEILANK